MKRIVSSQFSDSKGYILDSKEKILTKLDDVHELLYELCHVTDGNLRRQLSNCLDEADSLYVNIKEIIDTFYSVDSCDNIMSGTDCKYVIEDTYGAPQAGVDVKEFATYEELEEYLDNNPDVQDRMDEGYAIIKEC